MTVRAGSVTFLTLLACVAPAVRAQGAALVPVSDLAYADVDRLSELGVLDSIIIGQRPYSRREFGRIIRVARLRLDARSTGPRDRWNDELLAYAGRLVQELDARFADFSGDQPVDPSPLALLDGASFTYTSTNADRRGFLSSQTRPTEATIDPLADRRLGRPALRGQTGALELAHVFAPNDWLALQVRERFEYRAPDDTTLSRSDAEVLLASIRARYHNTALTVGRQQFAWAQSSGDGLFLASDAPALDQVTLSSDQPFALPGPLRSLGPTQAMIMLADLGASISHTHSRLLGYKVSIQPTSALELGGSFFNHFGGGGSRSSSFVNQLIDFFPFVDVFRHHNYTDTTRTLEVESDKVLGADGRLRLDALGGMLITGELLADDVDFHRLRDILTVDGSSTVAIIFPKIGGPALSLKLSAKHMGPLTYIHTELVNGITTRGRLLGDELGPDAKAFGARLSWTPSFGARLDVEGRSAIYSNAQYGSYYADSSQTRYVIYKASSAPNELRDRLIASLTLQGNDALALTIRGGAERVRNVDSQGGRRHDYVAAIAVRVGL